MPGGHSNAIREFIACQRAAGLEASGLSPATNEEFANPVEPGLFIQEAAFNDPAAVVSQIRERVGEPQAIVHLHAINRFTTDLARSARDAGIKVVMTSHGQLNVRSVFHGLQKAAYLAAFRSPVRYVAGIHVLTEREREQLRLMIPWFRGHIGMIPHVVETPGDPAPIEGTASAACNPNALTILHLGRLDVQTKGLDILLRAFATSGLDRARLILAGPDWNHGRATLEAEAAAAGCLDHVEFPGAVYGVDKQRLISTADLFVACSRWDAFNISLVEAMACGVPALVSDRLNLAPALAANDVAEIAKCNVEAIAAGLRKIGGDAARRKDLSSRGRRWVEINLSGSAVGRKFVEFYQRIASPPS